MAQGLAANTMAQGVPAADMCFVGVAPDGEALAVRVPGGAALPAWAAGRHLASDFFGRFRPLGGYSDYT